MVARWAQIKEDQIDYPLAKEILKTELEIDWEKRWMESCNGRTTKLFFPIISNRLACEDLCLNFVFTQFMSGHGKFGSHLADKKIRTNSPCRSGDDYQSLCHLVFDCPLL